MPKKATSGDRDSGLQEESPSPKPLSVSESLRQARQAKSKDAPTDTESKTKPKPKPKKGANRGVGKSRHRKRPQRGRYASLYFPEAQYYNSIRDEIDRRRANGDDISVSSVFHQMAVSLAEALLDSKGKDIVKISTVISLNHSPTDT